MNLLPARRGPLVPRVLTRGLLQRVHGRARAVPELLRVAREPGSGRRALGSAVEPVAPAEEFTHKCSPTDASKSKATATADYR